MSPAATSGCFYWILPEFPWWGGDLVFVLCVARHIHHISTVFFIDKKAKLVEYVEFLIPHVRIVVFIFLYFFPFSFSVYLQKGLRPKICGDQFLYPLFSLINDRIFQTAPVIVNRKIFASKDHIAGFNGLALDYSIEGIPSVNFRIGAG
jgi:hypothetical protein